MATLTDRLEYVIGVKAADALAEHFGIVTVDDLLRHADDKPTIGLILCKTKNNVVAEYALRGYNAPIGVAEWKAAITASLPAELENVLPTVEELEAELESGTYEGDAP